MERWIVILLALSLGVVPAAAAEPPQATTTGPQLGVHLPSGGGMGSFALRRLLRDAERDLGSGRAFEAREAYLAALAATEPGEKRRGDALWGFAVSTLQSGTPPPLGEAKAALDELVERHPRHPQHAAARLLALLVVELGEQQVGLREATLRLRVLEAECGLATTELGESAAGAAAVAAVEQARLRRQLVDARREVERLTQELARRNEALERLKQELIQRTSPPR